MALPNFIKPTKGKLILSLTMSTILVVVILSTPGSYQEIFLARSFIRKVVDIVVNVLVFSFILYPVSCIVFSIYHRVKK